MIKKKLPDKLFEDQVLTELLVDLFKYGIKINPFNQPIAETWMRLWREDFRFRNFILDRQCKLKPKRSLLIELLKDTKDSRNGFHVITRKPHKKIHYKI